MKKQVIAVDFDDVLMHFNEGFLAFHNRIYGTTVKYEDNISYDMKIVYGCDSDVIVERVKNFYLSQDHTEVEPIHGSVEAIHCLQELYTLDIVTSRSDIFQEATHAWTQKFFPNMFRELHFTNGFASEAGAKKRKKSDVCQSIGASILIDDALIHAEEVARKGISVLLPDRPWNRTHTPKGSVRVHSWDEIVSWIKTNL